MFDFLKTMTAPHFSVVDYGEGLVYFRCSKKLSLAETVAGYAVLPGGEKHALCVQVVQRRSDGIYLGRPTEATPGVVALEKHFLPDAHKPKEQMFYKIDPEESTRHLRTYSLRSEGFPGFKGMTAELSTEGCKVVLSGSIPDGTALTMFLDLADEQPPIRIRGEVQWSKQRDKKAWVVQLKFTEMDDEQKSFMRFHLAGLKVNPQLHRDEPEPS